MMRYHLLVGYTPGCSLTRQNKTACGLTDMGAIVPTAVKFEAEPLRCGNCQRVLDAQRRDGRG